jgi:hypothetical protein
VAAALLIAALKNPESARAQPRHSADDPKTSLLFRVEVGTPLKVAVGVVVLVRMGETRSGDGLSGGPGLELQASAGLGGQRIGAGYFYAGFPFFQDAVVTLTRTSSRPRRASPNATYLGAEAGLAVPVLFDRRRFTDVRPGFGMAYRLRGGGTEDSLTYTWNISGNAFAATWW